MKCNSVKKSIQIDNLQIVTPFTKKRGNDSFSKNVQNPEITNLG